MRRFIISAAILIIIVTGIILFITNIPVPPSIDLTKARIELNKAEIARSKQYAKYQYIQAKTYYDSAYFEWKTQNYLFILKRNYSKARYFANKSYVHSKESRSLAIANSRDISKYLEKKISEIKLFYNEYDRLLKTLPLSESVKKKYQISMMSFSEAKVAFMTNDLNLALKKIAISEELLEMTKYSISTQLTEYFKKYKHWKQYTENAIKSSRQEKNTVIVVDKFAKKCFVYNKGSLKHVFDVELGKNWIGEKLVRNDKATPEGIYQIQKKLERSQTKFYKALLINYPNDEDLQRFSQAKKKGEIPKNANIGGLIEIHGNGGKGVDWTNGCVALKDEDMDRLYDLVRKGTKVVIVGSLSKLSDIIDF